MLQEDQFPFHDRYEWEGKSFLGEGSYGKVWKVKVKGSQEFVAIKQMNMAPINQDQMLMESLKGEIAVTKEVSSEHTVCMLDFKINNLFTYIVLELCDGDLRKELCSRKITEPECVDIFG